MTTYLRASMLPSYPDCPRRAAAKQWRREIEDAGYALREIPPSVGAAVGTAVHAAATEGLRRQRDGEDPEPDAGVERAITRFRGEVEGGAVYDASTPDRRTAEAQIQRQARAYAQAIVPHVRPRIVENTWPGETEPRDLHADAGDGCVLTGQIDLTTDGGDVRDLKTGALPRPYAAQLGAYALLLRSHGERPRRLITDWMPRTRLKKPQDPPTAQHHDRSAAERLAAETVEAIKGDVRAWEAAGRASPAAFLPNPLSMMCSSKYCPAHSTSWCVHGRPEE